MAHNSSKVHFSCLADDVLFLIITFLDIVSLARVSRTDKYICLLGRNDNIWNALIVKYFEQSEGPNSFSKFMAMSTCVKCLRCKKDLLSTDVAVSKACVCRYYTFMAGGRRYEVIYLIICDCDLNSLPRYL